MGWMRLKGWERYKRKLAKSNEIKKELDSFFGGRDDIYWGKHGDDIGVCVGRFAFGHCGRFRVILPVTVCSNEADGVRGAT